MVLRVVSNDGGDDDLLINCIHRRISFLLSHAGADPVCDKSWSSFRSFQMHPSAVLHKRLDQVDSKVDGCANDRPTAWSSSHFSDQKTGRTPS